MSATGAGPHAALSASTAKVRQAAADGHVESIFADCKPFGRPTPYARKVN